MNIKITFATLMVAVSALQIGAVSPYINKVYEYRPAPGQFVNVYPEYESGDDAAAMAEKAGEQLCGDKNPGMISLGGYGGYVIFGFDHSIVNVAGEYDFKVYGNVLSGGGSSEPGIVMVSKDENGDGVPNDTWYELAGSEYNSSSTKKNYEITYYKPDENKTATGSGVISDSTYIRWTTNYRDEASGYVMKNIYHSQSYYPLWLSDTQLEFSGTRIANNATLSGGNYYLNSYDWGYVDNIYNENEPGLKIDWAVDADGNSVTLSSIDFVKVYTAVNQYCGWIGETSTEVCGAEDLHPDASSVSDVAIDENAVKLISRNGELTVISNKTFNAQIYSMSGGLVSEIDVVEGSNAVDISDINSGVYLLKTPYGTFKFVR